MLILVPYFVALVTHGCIIAALTLIGPDGKEVTRSPNPNGSILDLVSKGLSLHDSRLSFFPE